jgi:hypothetical protein
MNYLVLTGSDLFRHESPLSLDACPNFDLVYNLKDKKSLLVCIQFILIIILFLEVPFNRTKQTVILTIFFYKKKHHSSYFLEVKANISLIGFYKKDHTLWKVKEMLKKIVFLYF